MQHITSLQTVAPSDSPLRRSVMDKLLGPYAQDEALVEHLSHVVGAEALAWDVILRSQVEAGGLALGCERQSRFLSPTKPLKLTDVLSAYQAIASAFLASAGERRRTADMPIESRFRGYVQDLMATGVVGRGVPRPVTPGAPRRPVKPRSENRGRPTRPASGGAPGAHASTREGGEKGPAVKRPPRPASGRPDGARKGGGKGGQGGRSREAPATRPDPMVTGVIKDPLKFLARQTVKNRKRNVGVL